MKTTCQNFWRRTHFDASALSAVAVLLLMGLSLFTAVAYGAYLLGGVYAASGYIGFNVMVGVWLFREITRAPMMDD